MLRRYLLRGQSSQWNVITLMTAATVFMTLLGAFSLHSAPALIVDGDIVTLREGIRITRIGEIPVRDIDLWQLPTFKAAGGEAQWWQTQQHLYQAIADSKTVVLRFVDSTNTGWEILSEVGHMPASAIAKRLGLIYIVAAIYIFAAISVFRHHKRTTGFLCAFFLSSTALYLVSIAPVVHRPIVMEPELMRLLVDMFFIASTGQISIVHFSMVFPERKQILLQWPFLATALYVYAAIISVLYLVGIISLTSSLPFLVLWLMLMMGSFIHSMIYTEDEFMRKQVRITFIAVLLVAAFFIMTMVLPWPDMDDLVNNYALFSLMLPFGLILSLDNQRLYHDRLALEYNSRMEKERLHRELHDTVLNDLASIAIAVEGAERCPNDFERLRAKLDQIKINTAESSRQLRNFLWVIDDRQNSWEDIANSLRRLGYDLLGQLDIAFELDASIDDAHAKPPTPALKHAIYRAFREMLINIVKHANASEAYCTLLLDAARLNISVSDNGCGMELKQIGESGYGLNNMRRRVKEQGGELTIDSYPGSGTKIVMNFALSGESRVPPSEVFTGGWASSSMD